MISAYLSNLNNTNRISQHLLEKEMLDISIDNADKIKNKDAFLNDTYRVEEKFDGCLDYETKIITQEYGPIDIGKIVNDDLKCSVLSYNHDHGILEYKKITAKKNSGKSTNWVKITLDNNTTLTITDNHWVWSATHNEYMQVKDMVPGDLVKWGGNVNAHF